MKKDRIGTDLDAFLMEEGVLLEATAFATERVIAFQIAQEMKRCKLTKSEMAVRMKTIGRPSSACWTPLIHR